VIYVPQVVERKMDPQAAPIENQEINGQESREREFPPFARGPRPSGERTGVGQPSILRQELARRVCFCALAG
jgi:hypothetical protein